MWWWPFAKDKTFKESELLNGFTDWHTHILPGVDDGVRNMDDAMNILNDLDIIVAQHKQAYTAANLEVIRSQYSWEKLVDEHEKYFKSILAGR